MAAKFFLYWASGSPPCWRAQLVAEEKEIKDLESKMLVFTKGEHKSEQVIEWNHRGQLPTFVVDDSYSINESLAICEYLDRLYAKQGTQLTPDDPRELAKVLQRKYEYINLGTKWMSYIYCRMNQNGTPGEPAESEKATKLLTEFLDELKIWDKYAGEADYIAGNKISMADIVLFPYLAIYVRFGLDMAKTAPNLYKYYERMIKLPSVQKTWPPHWKESGPPEKLF